MFIAYLVNCCKRGWLSFYKLFSERVLFSLNIFIVEYFGKFVFREIQTRIRIK